ncbi:MAG: hypothetical protein Q8R39_04320 [bacterium]|nr:hypothetical protein [bacterium]
MKGEYVQEKARPRSARRPPRLEWKVARRGSRPVRKARAIETK